MADTSIRDNWGYDDYIAFLLVYAAYADFIVVDAERIALAQKVGEKQYEKMKDYFMELNDMESIDVIYEFKEKYCSDPEQVKKVMEEIKALMEQDEEMQPEEEALYFEIKRILQRKKQS